MVNYQVPGLFYPIQQPTPNSCWAAMFTMMLSWRRQQSIPIANAVAELGLPYTEYFRQNQGLPISANRELARDAGMRAEELMNLTAEGWEDMLRQHGLLWTSYGWRQFDEQGNEVRAGRHIVIVYGIRGDGSGGATTVFYVDPADGRRHEISFGDFVERHETGYTMRRLTRVDEAGFSQIIHF
jgi:hypothetical protein